MLGTKPKRLRLSHSALEVLLLCERKFQLDRLLVGGEKEDWPATVLGKAYGAGVASYMVHGDQDKAIFDCWMAYYPELEDDKRTMWVCINMLIASFAKLDDLRQEWDVAVFNGKPAVELGFHLDINEMFYFVGFIDLVLRNKYTGRHAIMEVKTTGLNLHNLDPLWQNSGQALGYSIVLDQIVGQEQSDYDVIYFAGQLGAGNGFEPKITPLIYPKNLMDRFNWFIALGMDVERLQRMLEADVFPMRGKNCLQYMKPCRHLGTCSLHNLDRYKEEEEDTNVYDFHFNLEEVVQNHLLRLTV